MIKNIGGSGYIIVNGGNPSGPYINSNSGQSMIGMVRYHNNNLEVYDGYTWMQISTGYASIDLSSAASSAISWAMTKMAEEAKLELLSKEHPAIMAAYNNLKRAEEQLKTTIILSKDEQTTS
jgi:hypothetical protein